VITAIRFARDTHLAVAVRSGGHSVAGHGVCDDGIVIDLSPMKGMRVDPRLQTAFAQAGLTWGEFDRETQAFGLATTGGRVTTTGIAGTTLGSGSGWLERKYGPVAANLLAVDLVTAEGEVVTASERENPELFWGVRGGGGNFGIATSFEYRLHELGPMLVGGILMYRLEQARELLPAWRDYIERAPHEVGGAFAVMRAPSLPFVPRELQGRRCAALIFVYAGEVEHGELAAEQMRALAEPEVDLVQTMAYTDVQQLLDPGNPPGRHQYWKSENLEELTDGAIETLLASAEQIPSPFTFLVIEPKGGAVARVDEDAMALGARDVKYTFYGIAIWEDPAQTDENVDWARELGAAMQPFTIPGVALDFLTESDEGASGRRSGPRSTPG
jgi:FAD/FMN-containing dehydrogenase